MTGDEPLIIYYPLALKLLKKLRDVGSDLLRIGGAKLFLQLGNDLSEGTLPIAMFEDLAPGALQFDCAFGEEDDALVSGARLSLRAPAASGGKSGLTGF
jgi:hypothetical protein